MPPDCIWGYAILKVGRFTKFHLLFMSTKSFTLTAGFLFLALGLLHVVRIIYGWEAVIAGWMMPLWVSGAVAIFAFFLSFQSFKINGK